MSLDIISLSIIQGISEILPISSSVNLYFFSKLLHINNFTFALKVALHAGSLITLLVYFYRELCDICRGLLGQKGVRDTCFMHLVLGTIPVVILGYFSHDFVKEFDSPKIMGILSIIFGILLYVFDKFSYVSKVDRNGVSLVKAFLIGCCQAIAIFPGISRLGICITASRMFGLSRRKAIDFSLMLAIPSICGSLVLEILSCYKNSQCVHCSNDVILGVILTALIGLIVILPCVRLMERKGFLSLMVYRILIGLAICFL